MSLISQDSILYTIAVFVGIAFLLKISLNIISAIVLQFVLPQKNILKRYGTGEKYKTWAVVTGGTDGIGLGFCEQLAKLGFNICIISRNKQKIDKVIEILKNDNKGCNFRSIVANFKDGYKTQFFQNIIKELKDLDIGILINNVGTSQAKYIEQMQPQSIIDIITINCNSMAVLTSMMIPLIKKRNKGAIINMSSYLGENSGPIVSIYSSTKAFNTFFSEAVSMQHPQIDIMVARPMFVQSPLSKQKKSFSIPDRREHARYCLRQLPYCYETNGYILHTLNAYLIKFLKAFIPNCVIRWFTLQTAIKVTKSMMQ